MKLRLAVCDDDREDLTAVLSLVDQYDKKQIFDVCSFSSAAALYQSALENSFDIVLLDIEMPPPSGYEVASLLRKLEAPPLVIFLTRSSAYSVRGYGIAFRYLIKPVEYSLLADVLDLAVEEVSVKQFYFYSEGNSRVLSLSDIYYFEVKNHYTYVHTADTSYGIRSPLKDICAQLPSYLFASPHTSYLVNLSHIQFLSSSELHLTSGTVIPVSRRQRAEFERQFHLYLRR